MHSGSFFSKIYFPTGLFKRLLLLVILFPFNSLFASEQDNMVLKGLDYCYNFKWSKAEESFRKIMEKYPDDPRGYHYLSSIYFWYYLSNKSENDFDNFKKYSDQAISKAGDVLDKKENDVLALYITGSNYNYRTVAFAAAEKYLDAVWAAKKSESYLSDCLKADSSMYDAYLGLGLYNFAMANIPSGFKWALKLAGISGEETKGLRYIKITAEKGKFAKTEAQYYFSQILSDAMMDPFTASSYLEKLIKKYPDNLLFNYGLGVAAIKKRNISQAEKILSVVVKKEEPRFTQIISFSNFLLGDVYFRKNNFDLAKKYYRLFLSSTHDNDYTGIASYRLALCFEITGSRDEAKKYFDLAQKGNMDIEDDIFAERKGTIYAKRTLAENEIDLIKFNNMIEVGSYAAAADSLKQLLGSVKTDKVKAEIYLYLSEAAYYLEDYGASLTYALNIPKLNTSDETWIKPWAYYNAARASVKLINSPSPSERVGERPSERLAEAKKYLAQADDYSSYDYQKKLEHMIKNLERAL